MSAGSYLLLDRLREATKDEYTIEGELGRGGMAAVFLARDIALDRRVAIKVMLPDLAGVPGFQDRFVIEARTAAHLDHPGIVTVYSVRQRGDLTFIVMKYIEGRTLDQVLSTRGALDEVVVATIGSRVAEALHFAHAHGVVHRDIKPSNIIIDSQGRPVVTDFGIAKVGSSPSLTVAGSTLGTPTYMSPEQCRGLPATAASDQYSLGVMIYELVTGRAPFSGNLFELLGAHTNDPPPRIRDSKANTDPALEAAIERMLAKEPTERFSSLGDVAKTLAARVPRRSHAQEMKSIIDGISPPRRPFSSTAFDLANATTEELPAPTPVAPPGDFTRAFGASTLTPTNPVETTAPAPVFAPPTPPPLFVAPTEPPVAAPGTVLVETPRGPVENAGAIAAPEPPPKNNRALFAGAAVLILGVVGYAVFASSNRETPAPTPVPATTPKTDSAPAPTPATVPVVVAESIAPAKTDSTAKRDSSPPAVVTPPPVTARPPSVPAPKNEKSKTAPKTDVPSKARTDSIAARCARLNERFALGAELPRADSLFLRQECARQRP